MRPVIYSSEQVQAWEQNWFAAGNSSYGLMQQAAWQMTRHIVQYIDDVILENVKIKNQQRVTGQFCVGIWCGAGNNAGDGWLIAAYLKQMGYLAWVYELAEPQTPDSKYAKQYAEQASVDIYKQADGLPNSDLIIDAIFGIGLNREVTGLYKQAIEQFNQYHAHKIAVDIPSGLHANTGAVLGVACSVDLTLTVLAYKAGLFTGQGKVYAGQVQLIQLIPANNNLQPLARLDIHPPILPKRSETGHKGTYGHVLVIGGDENMGGASIMSAEAALAVGAGKVTLLTHRKHHGAALTRCPNVMTLSIPAIEDITVEFAEQVTEGIDCIVIGMGLGRHAWGKAVWDAFLPILQGNRKPKSHSEKNCHIQTIIIDADALWHLADEQISNTQRHQHWYLTPHSGEAARLLGIETMAVEQDRIAAIYALKEKFGAQCLLKGAGSLSLDAQGLSVCGLGNAGMATAGMGDVLAGMAGGLLAQLPELPLHQIVALHAAAGDLLAQQGERGLQASQMLDVIQQVVN